MPDSSELTPKKKPLPAIGLGVAVMAVCIGIIIATGGPSPRGRPVEPTGTPVTAESRLGLSTLLQVEFNGRWYAAKVRDLKKDGSIVVHYDGWDSRYDEEVPRSRMRLAPVPKLSPD